MLQYMSVYSEVVCIFHGYGDSLCKGLIARNLRFLGGFVRYDRTNCVLHTQRFLLLLFRENAANFAGFYIKFYTRGDRFYGTSCETWRKHTYELR